MLVPLFAENIDDKSAGTGTYSLDQASNGTGDITLTVDIVATDDLTVGGIVRVTPTAQAITNGQVLTVADGVYNITSSGGANGTTNAITLANPTTAGDIVILHVLAASTNLVGLTDGGNLRLSAAYNMNDDDTITLMAPSTSIWIELSRSAN